MLNKKSLSNFFFIILTIISIVGLQRLYHSRMQTTSFVDENNFIAASKNFFTHANYSPEPEIFFNPGVSAGIWCNFPSGIAASSGAELAQIRLVSYLFSLFMLAFASGIYLYTRGFGVPYLFYFIVCAVGLFMGFVVYPEGALMTLGEMPALGYLGAGLTFLSISPLTASLFLGLSVFGGKLVNIAFCVPVLFFWFWNQKYNARQILKMSFWFIFPEIFWIAVIFICGGFGQGVQWIKNFVGTILFMGSLAAGKTEARLPFFERFHSPKLEWVGYPFNLKLKIILMLLVPFILLVGILIKKRKSETSKKVTPLNFPILTGLVCGEAVFAIWYFGLHPYMWIRHIQLAVSVGLGCLLWIAVQNLKKPEKKWPYYATLAVITLLLLTRLK